MLIFKCLHRGEVTVYDVSDGLMQNCKDQFVSLSSQIVACEQALCLGKKNPSPQFPTRPEACSQASQIYDSYTFSESSITIR